MNEFSFDNIDLFYYHSTDVDITRIYSILHHGIVSAQEAKNSNLEYYHRNYIKSSSREKYIAVSHFPRTFFHHYHLKNELYDSASNKVTFVLDGTLQVLEKQHYKNRYEYTNERHFENKIEKSMIKGIVIRQIDFNKKIKDLHFSLNYTDQLDQIKKCFDTISFLQNQHQYKTEINHLYILIGQLMEIKAMHKETIKDKLKEIEIYMQEYLHTAYQTILKKENPTLKDIILLYNYENLPIYIMNKYDIQPFTGMEVILKQTHQKLEQKRIDKKNKKLYEKEQTYLKQMSAYGTLLFNLSYFLQGPMTKKDEQLKEKTLNLTKKET